MHISPRGLTVAVTAARIITPATPFLQAHFLHPQMGGS
jgi:hypothetical protein